MAKQQHTNDLQAELDAPNDDEWDDALMEARFEKRMEKAALASEKLGQLLLKGWTLLSEHCDKCQTPLMKYRSGQEKCIICDVKDVADPQMSEPRTPNVQNAQTTQMSMGNVQGNGNASSLSAFKIPPHQPQTNNPNIPNDLMNILKQQAIPIPPKAANTNPIPTPPKPEQVAAAAPKPPVPYYGGYPGYGAQTPLPYYFGGAQPPAHASPHAYPGYPPMPAPPPPPRTAVPGYPGMPGYQPMGAAPARPMAPSEFPPMTAAAALARPMPQHEAYQNFPGFPMPQPPMPLRQPPMTQQQMPTRAAAPPQYYGGGYVQPKPKPVRVQSMHLKAIKQTMDELIQKILNRMSEINNTLQSHNGARDSEQCSRNMREMDVLMKHLKATQDFKREYDF